MAKTARAFSDQTCYGRAEMILFFRQKKGMGRKGDKHAVGGILCSGVTPSILTQARRRRATPFVRLVSSQVKKTEK